MIDIMHVRMTNTAGSNLYQDVVFTRYRFAYIYLDDFNNLLIVQSWPLSRLLGALLNPFSDVYRPLGLMAYRTVNDLFGLNPVPYHLLSWVLVCATVWLVYLVLARVSASRLAAACPH